MGCKRQESYRNQSKVLQKSKKVLQKSKQGRKYRVSILKDAKRKFRSLSAFCKKFLWVLVLFNKGGILTS